MNLKMFLQYLSTKNFRIIPEYMDTEYQYMEYTNKI